MRLSEQFKKIEVNINRFIDFYGLRHQFQPGGLYADIDISLRLEKHIALLGLTEEAMTSDPELKIILTAPDDFYADLDAVVSLEHACLSLFQKLALSSISQLRVIEKVIAYQKACDIEDEDLIDNDGHCAGIAYIRCFGELFRREAASSDKVDFLARLASMNAMFRRMVEWDGTADNLNDELSADFEFFLKKIVPLQIENTISDSLSINEFCLHSIGTVSWVFNQKSLLAYFEKFVLPSQSVVMIGSNRHASCVAPIASGGYWYMNANSAHGDVFLSRFEDLVERICGGLSVGHSLTYPDRMPLHLQLWQQQSVPKFAPDAGICFLAEQFPHDLQLVAANGYNALTEAVLTKNLPLIDALLSRGIECNARTVDGYEATHFAIILGELDIFKRLLAAQKDIRLNTPFPSSSDFAGHTLLNAAIRLGQNEAVNVLLAHPNTEIETRTTAEKLSPAEFAIKYDNQAVFMALVGKNMALLQKQNPVSGQTLLGYAASLGKFECATWILGQGEELPVLSASELAKLRANLPPVYHVLLPVPVLEKPVVSVSSVTKNTSSFFRSPGSCKIATTVAVIAAVGVTIASVLS